MAFLRKLKDDEGDFVLITFWKNLEVVKNFAGENYERAKYYPEDKEYLPEFEEKVVHYEVFSNE